MIMSSRLRFSAAAIALVGALGVAPASFGQEQAEGAASEADAIVVTAQRREQRLSEVPLSITAIGGEALKERNLADVADLGKLVPGLSVSDSGYATPIYTLRGVGVNEQSLGSSSSVAVYVDEVPLAYPVLTQGAALDLQRLEVLKGPQGTLYGQNATGGAVNYIANKPTDTLSAGLTGSFGRFNRGDVEAFVSGPLGDMVKARIAGRAQFGSGWQRSLSRGDTIGDIERYAGRFIVEFQPSERLRFTVNANGWIDKSDTLVPQLLSFPAAVLPEVRDNTLANDLIPGRNARDTDWDADGDFVRDDRFWQASLRADWDVTDDVTLTSITAYGNLDRYQKSELDGLANYRVLWSEQSGSIKTFTQEARLTANFHGVTWILGANLSDDRTEDFVDQDLRDSSQVRNLFGFPATGAALYNNQDINNWSVFTNIDIPLGSQVTLGAGIRLSEERRRFEGCSVNRDAFSAPAFTAVLNFFRNANGLAPVPTAGVGDCVSFYTTPASLERELDSSVGLYEFTVVKQKLRETNVPWNINLSWNPGRDALLYARVSRGYKAGNFSTLGSTDAQGFQPIAQEKLTAYELGGRFSLGRTLSFEAAAFQYDYIDKQVRARVNVGPPFGNINAQLNIPKSRIRGAEFAATVRPVAGLTLSGSGTYLDSEVRDYSGFTIFNTVVDFDGARLPFTSKWTFNADARYEFPLSDGLHGFAGVNVAYRSKTTSLFVDPNAVQVAPTLVNDLSYETFDINAYTLVDAQLGLQGDRWKAFIWGKNIFDKYYWTNVTRVSTVNIRYPGQPATYGVTVSLAF